jgi:hypothetical protein
LNARIDRLNVGANFGRDGSEKGCRKFNLGFKGRRSICRRFFLGLLGLGSIARGVFLLELFAENFGSNPGAAGSGDRKGYLQVYAQS